MLSTEKLKRVFVAHLDGEEKTLEDPNEGFAPKEVAEFYSARYPELTNASIVGPVVVEDHLQYEFKVVLGTKG